MESLDDNGVSNNLLGLLSLNLDRKVGGQAPNQASNHTNGVKFRIESVGCL